MIYRIDDSIDRQYEPTVLIGKDSDIDQQCVLAFVELELRIR